MSFKTGGGRREKGGRQIMFPDYLLYMIHCAGCLIDGTFRYYSRDQKPTIMQ